MSPVPRAHGCHREVYRLATLLAGHGGEGTCRYVLSSGHFSKPEGLPSHSCYRCPSRQILHPIRFQIAARDALGGTFSSSTTPAFHPLWNPAVAKPHSLAKEKRFNTHSSPRPPQAPAASFKSLYRKCSGAIFVHNPSVTCRSTSDRVLRTSRELRGQ